MELSGVDELKQQQQQQQKKKKTGDALEIEDAENLVDVPLVQISEYGMTSLTNETMMPQFIPITPNKCHRLQDWQPVEVVQVTSDGPENKDGIASVLHSSSHKKPATSPTNETMNSQLAPITPNKCQRLQDWQPMEVVHGTSQGPENKGTSQTASAIGSLDMCTGNGSLKSMAPVTPYKSKEIQDYHESNECMHTEVPPQVEQIKPHEYISFNLVEAGSGKNGKEKVSVIKTPRKNAEKRKKHRPKVIQEGKPAKKAKPEKPTPSENKENSTPKRVYVRRKKVLKAPSGVLGESMEECGSKVEKCNVDQLTVRDTKSVRRSLNFNLDSSERDASHVDSSVQETFVRSTNNCSARFAVKLSQGPEMVVNKSPVGIVIDLNRSPDEILEEYIGLAECPTSAQPFTRDTVSEELDTFDVTNNGLNGITRVQTDQGQVNLNSHSDAIDYGTKDNGCIEFTQHSSTYGCLRDTRFMHVYKRRKTNRRRAKSILSSYIPAIHTKRRTARVKPWRCNKAVLNGFREFIFTYGQNSRTLDRLKYSDIVLAISPTMITTKKRSKIPTRVRKPLWSPEKLKNLFVTSQKYGPQTCMEALFADTHYKLKTKKRTGNRHLSLVSMSPNMKKEHEITSFRFRCLHQQIVLGLTTSATRNFLGRSHFQVTSAQDHWHSRYIQGPLCVSFQSRAIVRYVDDIDDIVHKFRCLNINGDQLVTAKEQNSLIPYREGSKIVPYEHVFGLVKKKRSRAKVDLDPETNRVWKLLMGSESVDGDGGPDMDKERWWEEERQIFRGRIDSFIARMHLIQGDRRFSKWKGSVVDSVVGVFLTQNVSDHLSSSAFMSLAARYPLSSRDGCKKSYSERTAMPKEEADEGILAPDESYDLGSMGTHESGNFGENAAADDSGSLGSNSRDGLQNSKGEFLHIDERYQPFSLKGPQNMTYTPLNNGSTNLAEAKDGVSMEEVVSSQNLLETLTQTASQVDLCLESISEADNVLIRSKFCTSDCSTFAMEHKLVRATVMSNESYNNGNEGILFAENCAWADAGNGTTPTNMLDSSGSSSPSAVTSDNLLNYAKNDVKFVPHTPFVSHRFHASSSCEMGNTAVDGEESCLPSTSFEVMKAYNTITAEGLGYFTGQQISTSDSKITVDSHVSLRKQYVQTRNCALSIDISDKTPQVQDVQTSLVLQGERDGCSEPANGYVVNILTQKQHHREETECADSCSKLNENLETSKANNSRLKDGVCVLNSQAEMETSTELKKMKFETGKRNFDWDSLRKETFASCSKKERSSEERDSLDWDAVRCADVNEISKAIRERGMNNVLAARIKDFLNRVFKEHGSIDLEWLRDVPPDEAKEYLLSIRGLGLKSVQCVLLLTLHHLAFPVDTNVGRVCVRLGWVPLQPLPESLQLHLLELYPMIDHIQKYLWPRLCTLDQETLYELHYQMITFGKVFCTKSRPNCNACPMRGECKHFASAFASARLSLPGPEEKRLVTSRVPFSSENDVSPNFSSVQRSEIEGNLYREGSSVNNLDPVIEGKRLVTSRIPIVSENGIGPNFSSMPQSEIEGKLYQEGSVGNNLDPIIEEPPTPEQDCSKTLESAIEDDFYEDPDDIPVIKLNLEKFNENLQNYMQENNVEVEGVDMSKALVALSAEAASIPMPKLKNVSRLRTEHRVYELPDSHPLLESMDQREHNDPCPYLLAIWTPGETAHSNELPQSCCNFQGSGELCKRSTCFDCNSRREEQARTVRGTLLIPCRTAMRGSFPLNGTYFQVNEVFADHISSCKPIDVPREWIWNLPRRTVYFGTSIPTIFRGLTTEEIQLCFWRGFVCVRGFDRVSRAPKPLFARLHFPLSKESSTRKMDRNEGQSNTSATI